METRILGIDLAVTAAHTAIVLDLASNEFVSQVLHFRTDPADLERVLAVARQGAAPEVRLIAVLEATGMAWFSVGWYLHQHGVQVYRVNGQQVRDLRRIYQRHAKSDRIDVRVLARLYSLHPERLHVLVFPTGPQFALQRAVRELHRQVELIAATKLRLLATDQFAWLNLADLLPPYEAAARWLRENWYDPWRVQARGAAEIAQAWRAASPDQPADTSWAEALVERAAQVIALYGQPDCLDYVRLQAGLRREQARLAEAETQAHFLRLKVVRPLYRQLHPQRYLETLYGVGQDSAAVYVAFIQDIRRFPTREHFRAWSGLVPFSAQSGETRAQGLHITQAGPDLLT